MEQESKRHSPRGYLDVDPQAYEVELNMWRDESDNALNRIPRLAPSDKRSSDRLKKLLSSEEIIYDTKDSLIERININPDSDQDTEEDIDARISCTILDGASNLLMSRRLEQIKRIAQSEGFSNFLDQYIQLLQFCDTGDVYAKIGGISIKDIDSNPNIHIPSAYRFFMAARGDDDDIQIINENKTQLTIKYPYMTRGNIVYASREILAMSNMDEGDFEETVRSFLQTNPQGTEKEIILTAKEIIKKMFVLKQKIYNTILDPDFSDFQALRSIAEKFLSDEKIRDLAIIQLGIDTRIRTINAYRKAKGLAQTKNENSAFYEGLTHHLRNFAEEDPTLLTQDDLDTLIDNDTTLNNVTTPTLEELRKLGVSIFQKSQKKEYEIEPQGTSWQTPLLLPTSVKVAFPQGNPNRIVVELHYQNKEDEVLDLILAFDTRRGEFDWSVLEDPNDPEMESKRNAAFLSAKSILLNIQKQVDTEYQERVRQKTAKTQSYAPTPKISGTKLPYVPKVKEERQKRQRPLTPIQEIVQSNMSLPDEIQRINNQIVVPEEKSLSAIMKNLSSQDTQLVAEGIDEYNQRGVGQFERLGYSGKAHKPLYTLRVNTGRGGGGIRILLQEIPSSNDSPNTHAFEIVDIDYRKNIYRKRGL